MAKAHSEIQAAQTESHQDITDSDESLDALRDILFPEYSEAYRGPGAYTAEELNEMVGHGTHEQARYRARKAVTRGEMVEVKVLRYKKNGGGQYVVTAWVLKNVYDKWVSDNDAANS